MKLPLPLLIGIRYVLSPRDFLSSIASLAVAGLSLSIAILVVVQAVLTGFEYELRERILGILPHITIETKKRFFADEEFLRDVSQIEGVIGVSSVVEDVALLVVSSREPFERSSNGSVEGVNSGSRTRARGEPILVQGIDPHQHNNASALLDFVADDDLARLLPGSFGVLVGSVTAKRLGISRGDVVTLVVRKTQVSLAGYIPRQKTVRVLAVLETGSFMDRNRVYMHFADASRLYRTNGHATSYQVRIEDPYQAKHLAGVVRSRLLDRNQFVSYWSSEYQFGYLHQAIMASRFMLLLIFSLLVAVAAFNLISTVAMMVSERRRDVAVLRTLGGDRKVISLAFLTAGMAISLIGLFLGCVIGFAIGWVLEIGFPWFQKLLNVNLLSEYFVHSLRVEFVLSDLLTVFVIGLILCLVAILSPTVRAASMNPAEVLRYD
ncbi:MAG: FtsX-like permease family protein [Gammaproteobacteria bacterium]|nr:FtsX-like permease family protein [Gammaproteobacteria bacterium]